MRHAIYSILYILTGIVNGSSNMWTTMSLDTEWSGHSAYTPRNLSGAFPNMDGLLDLPGIDLPDIDLKALEDGGGSSYLPVHLAFAQ